jgi:hypothetical protein
MTLINTWELNKNFVVVIFGVWIFGLLQAASGQLGSDAPRCDSRVFGPYWNRPDTRWQRPVAATGASGQ